MNNLVIPAEVPKENTDSYRANFDKATGGSGRLLLFAGVQKAEHLNKDFYGGGIAPDDANPEHLFKVAKAANISVFATQMGHIARYGNQYDQIHSGGIRGNGTGRNIHQRPFNEAVKMANAIYSVTVKRKTMGEVMEAYFGQ